MASCLLPQKGEVGFDDLVKERGLKLDDIDMGDVTEDQLGAAGKAVFALAQPGLVGPCLEAGAAGLFTGAFYDPNQLRARRDGQFGEGGDAVVPEHGADFRSNSVDRFEVLLAIDRRRAGERCGTR